MAGDIFNDPFDRYDEPEYASESREVRCNLCNERGLYWEERGRERFVLVDEEGKAHAPFCKGRVASADEFSNLEGT